MTRDERCYAAVRHVGVKHREASTFRDKENLALIRAVVRPRHTAVTGGRAVVGRIERRDRTAARTGRGDDLDVAVGVKDRLPNKIRVESYPRGGFTPHCRACDAEARSPHARVPCIQQVKEHDWERASFI